MTMKKEGIQSRNRKASAKTRKRKQSDQDSNPEPDIYSKLHFPPPKLGTSLRSTIPSSHHLHPGKLPIDTNTRLAAPPAASSRFYPPSRHPRYYDGLGGSFSLSPSDPFAGGGSSYGGLASFSGFAPNSGQQNLNCYSRNMIGASV